MTGLLVNHAKYHRACLKCVACNQPLAELGQTLLMHDNKFYCKSDYQILCAELCCACGMVRSLMIVVIDFFRLNLMCEDISLMMNVMEKIATFVLFAIRNSRLTTASEVS